MKPNDITETWNLLKVKLRSQYISLSNDEEELLGTIQRVTGRSRDDVIGLIRELTEPLSGALEEW